jgi:hypothetical protein
MNEDSDTRVLSLNQQIVKLQARKGELKGKVKNLQEFARKQFLVIEILERRIKRKCDLSDIKEESIEHLLCKQRKILKYLDQLEEENTNLEVENRSLKRARCCHRNEY